MKIVHGAYEAFDKRFKLGPLSERLFSPMPKWANWTYSFGGITFLLFLIQVVSGIYLAFFYTPSAQLAWKSVSHIETEVFLGHFFRSMHRWGAAIFILFLLAHALRVLLSRAYRFPRELIWWTGVGLLMLGLAFVYTGYLLPWDVRAYWEVLTSHNIALQLPGLGKAIDAFLLAAGYANQVPIGRYFTTHALLLPILLGAGLAVHFMMIRRLGVTSKAEVAEK